MHRHQHGSCWHSPNEQTETRPPRKRRWIVSADEPANVAALLERADLLTDEKNFDGAIADLRAAAKVKPGEKTIMSRLAYAPASRPERRSGGSR